MLEWLAWLGRGEEKRRVCARLDALKERYGALGERVIRLSQRAAEARPAEGSTRQAFEFVESSFARATGAYADIGALIEPLEADLARGRVGDFGAVERALAAVEYSLDELERNLTVWEQNWRSAPHKVEEAARALADLRIRVEQAGRRVGGDLPLAEQIASLDRYLERIRQTLAAGNPIEAVKQVEDLRIARERLEQQVSTYSSGAAAIEQAAEDLEGLRRRLAGLADPPAQASEALASAEALHARLRPALVSGQLDAFQADLLQLHRHLASARAALR